MAGEANLPVWVCHRDGSLEPFDSERIAQRLFAATAIRGQPDPLLSRDLAAGVLHFLSGTAQDRIPTTELSDVIVKVVRELGYPELALALTNCVTAPPGPEQFPRDVAAAIDAGMLEPIETEGEVLFMGGVIRLGATGLTDALLAARKVYRQFVAIDGPEWLFDDADSGAATSWVDELRAGLSATGLIAILNLNIASPPVWAAGEPGPLFSPPSSLFSIRRDAVREELVRALLAEPMPGLRIDWHFPTPGSWDDATCLRLQVLIESACNGKPIVFVPDRMPEAPLLAEGLDRTTTDQLGALGIRWQAVIAHHAKVGGARDPFDAAVARIPSLVSLASAYFAALRRRVRRDGPAELREGFRIDRAACTIVPLDIDATMQDCGPELAAARRRLILRSLALAMQASRGVSLSSPIVVLHIVSNNDSGFEKLQRAMNCTDATHCQFGSSLSR